MASPTAIPNPGASAHHQPSTPPPPSSSSANAFSRSPTGTTPNPLVSPIYTSAGRSAFSLPGPNSNSTSPTTTSWYSAGFASNNSQRVRSPTANFTPSSSSTVTPQRDYFMESNTSPVSAHYRKASFGSASQSSSISSADLEPTTPKAAGEGGGGGGVPLGRVPSISMGSSFEQLKGHRQSWGGGNAGWNGLNGFRSTGGTEGNGGAAVPVAMPSSAGGGAMGGIFRKFSFGSASQTPTKSGTQVKIPAGGNASNGAAMAAPASAPSQVISQPVAEPVAVVEPAVRGRQASVSAGGKRRPSPMGERLLMGHFNAH